MSVLHRLWPRLDAETVVREHGPEVYRRLRRIFGPSADVDDAYQSVFVEVLRSLPTYAGRAKLATWIRRITYNVAYQEMRGRYRRGEAIDLDEAPPQVLADAGLTDELEQREILRHLYAALAKLEAAPRLAVVLHDIEGLTLREIGEATGRPLPTVASQLAAGRAQLARALGQTQAAPAEDRQEGTKEVEP